MMTATAPPFSTKEVRPSEKARRTLGKMFLNPYMMLAAALTVLALVLPFFDAKGIIASLFILAITAGLRLGYTTRQALREQTRVIAEQTTAIRANNDLLHLAVTNKVFPPTDTDEPPRS